MTGNRRLQIHFTVPAIRAYCYCLHTHGVYSFGGSGEHTFQKQNGRKAVSPIGPSLCFGRTHWSVVSLSLACSFPEPGGVPGGEGSPGRAAAASLQHQTCSHGGEQGLPRTSRRPNEPAWRATRCSWTVARISLSFNKTFMWTPLKPEQRGFGGASSQAFQPCRSLPFPAASTLSAQAVAGAGKSAWAPAYCICFRIKPVWECLVIDNVVINSKSKILFQFNQHLVNRADLAVWRAYTLSGEKIN